MLAGAALDFHQRQSELTTFSVLRYGWSRKKVVSKFYTARMSASDDDVQPVPATTGHSRAASNLAHVILAFRNRNANFSETPYVRVDVTEKFSFLVTKMSPYFDR